MLRPLVYATLPSLTAGTVAYAVFRVTLAASSSMDLRRERSLRDSSPLVGDRPSDVSSADSRREHTLRDGEIRRSVLTRSGVSASATLADVRCVFKTIRAATPEARERLVRLAERVDNLTRARGYALDVLEELASDDPLGPEVYGVHYSPSSANHIAVRLREPRPDGAWLPDDDVLAVLCHELAHCEHEGHTPEFYALTAELCGAVRVAPSRMEGQRCVDTAATPTQATRPGGSDPSSEFREIAQGHLLVSRLAASATHASSAAVLTYGLCVVSPLATLLVTFLALGVASCVLRRGGRSRAGAVALAAAFAAACLSLGAAKTAAFGHAAEAPHDPDADDSGTTLGDALGLTLLFSATVMHGFWEPLIRWAVLGAVTLIYAVRFSRSGCSLYRQDQQQQRCSPLAPLLPAAAVSLVGLCGADPWLAVCIVGATLAAVMADPDIATWASMFLVIDGSHTANPSIDVAGHAAGSEGLSIHGRTLQSPSGAATPLQPSPEAGASEHASLLAADVEAGSPVEPDVSPRTAPASRVERAAAVRAAAEARAASSLHPSVARKAAAAAAAADEEARAAAARRRDWGSGRLGGAGPVGLPSQLGPRKAAGAPAISTRGTDAQTGVNGMPRPPDNAEQARQGVTAEKGGNPSTAVITALGDTAALREFDVL